MRDRWTALFRQTQHNRSLLVWTPARRSLSTFYQPSVSRRPLNCAIPLISSLDRPPPVLWDKRPFFKPCRLATLKPERIRSRSEEPITRLAPFTFGLL